MLRGLYSAALYLLLLPLSLLLARRGLHLRDYLPRAGGTVWTDAQPRAWLHAVSVGEVNAAAPLLNALRRQRPDIRWVVTTVTPTGAERVRALWGREVEQAYLPYDVPAGVRRFLERFRPQLGLILETELWPNLLLGCRDRGIPVYVLNARLSARSLRGYRLLRPLLARVLCSLRGVVAQSPEDAARFIALGAQPQQVQALGNLKFDVELPSGLAAFVSEFRRHVPVQRPVWIAASTHEGEEAAVLGIHQALRRRWPDLLLLWAPRHPERFARVEALAREAGLQVALRSRAGWPSAGTDVFVIDTLGELMAFYACAQVAFVGGSLQAIGGHNLLEPAAVGTPVVSGPHLHHFVAISRYLEAAGALVVAADAAGVGQALDTLLADPARRQEMANAGRDLVAAGRGALERTVALVARDLPAPVSPSPAGRC